jgi:hypothetical protein
VLEGLSADLDALCAADPATLAEVRRWWPCTASSSGWRRWSPGRRPPSTPGGTGRPTGPAHRRRGSRPAAACLTRPPGDGCGWAGPWPCPPPRGVAGGGDRRVPRRGAGQGAAAGGGRALRPRRGAPRGLGPQMRYGDFWRALASGARPPTPTAWRGRPGQREARRPHLSQSFEGMWFLDGVLDPIGGEAVSRALGAIEDELFEADWAEAKARTCASRTWPAPRPSAGPTPRAPPAVLRGHPPGGGGAGQAVLPRSSVTDRRRTATSTTSSPTRQAGSPSTATDAPPAGHHNRHRPP